jgi:hypothetical protein
VTRAVLGGSARVLEPDLLRFVADDQARLRADLARAARPLRIVVPSGALRAHLAASLTRAIGRGLLGVTVQTLATLAHEIALRVGSPRPNEDLFPIQVRRSARLEPALHTALDDLLDGYAAVRAAVDDLLDAGFGPAHAEVVDEALSEQGFGVESPERALVRVGARVAVELDAGSVAHRSILFARAREVLESDAARALPARAIAIYGFADATGVQADLLAALVQRAGAAVWLERPEDPSGGRSVGGVFGASLRERLGGAAGSAVSLGSAPPARLEIWRARDPFEEARAIAGRLSQRLAEGAAAERIAVIARDLAPYRLALRRHLAALAVPFSGAGEPGPVSAAGRRLAALLDVLREGEAVPAERWLEAAARLPGGESAGAIVLLPESRSRLVHALHAVGAAALRDAASEPESVADRHRRASEGQALAALSGAARALLRELATWPAAAAQEEHALRLQRLVRETLGWSPETPGAPELDAALADARGDLALEQGEFLDWIARSLAGEGRVPLGGDGGGVQVLSVMEARGLAFDHVFLLGLNRGVFPRPIREDPLLPDRARRRLRDVLPDLPVKREGFDEERFLFAQILASSPSLTLSFSEWDEQGRPLAPSPLLDAVTRGRRAAATLPAPAPALATPRQRACEAGLRASRQDFAAALGVALQSSGAAQAAGIDPGALARSRVAVLDELDPRDARRRAAGPYLGFVGGPRAGDPRVGPIFVTRLEGLARCAWQVFLSRVLRLTPPPDARGALPRGDDARLLGVVVHAALEEIAAAAPGSESSLAALRPGDAREVAWPEPGELQALLLRAARKTVRKEALPLESYAHALARRAAAYVEAARRVDWSAEPPRVLGRELPGSWTFVDAEGSPREIRFTADRVDARGPSLWLTDYKSGAPPATARNPGPHADALRERIARGEMLQAAVYAAAAGERGAGRYLYLRPDLPDAVRELVAPAQPEDRARLLAAVGTLLAAWDAGAFVPRLREPARDQEPNGCRFCEVREACLRGDSGARQRLGAWAEGAAHASPPERAAHALWRLPEASA